MLIQNLLKRKQANAHNQTAGYVPFLLVAILVATIGMRLYAWINDGSNAPLLTHVDSLIQFSNINDISAHTKTPIILPTELFGANPYVIGVYPTDSKEFPANSIAIVFTKNHARSFEMDVIPNKTLDQAIVSYSTFPHESVVIRENVEGAFIRLRHDDVLCKYPRDTSHPSFCPFKNLLMFENKGTLIRLASDGNHLSDGELLEIARSIK